MVNRSETNPWFQPPPEGQTYRHIDGQLCWWDNDSPDAFGQVWIPVCPWCRHGPLNHDQTRCGEC